VVIDLGRRALQVDSPITQLCIVICTKKILLKTLATQEMSITIDGVAIDKACNKN
jgi:hypothetical protein